MTFDNHQISGRQCRRSLLTELFGISVFLLTSAFTKLYGANCFQMLLTGGAISLLLGLYYYYLAKNQTLAYGKQVAEAFPRTGCLIAVIYGVRFCLRGGFMVSMFCYLLDGYLMKDAGFAYTAIPIILVSAYGAFYGREKRLRAMEMLMWFVMIPFAIVLLFLVKDVDVSNFRETVVMNVSDTVSAREIAVTGSRQMGNITTSISQKCLGILYPAALFSNLEFILFLIPKIRTQDRSVKNVVVPVAGAVICNFLLMFLVVGTIGYANCETLSQPVIRVMQSISLPGAFLRRLDILVLAFWICAVFGVLSGCIFYSGRMLRDNCRYLKSRTFYPWEIGLVAVAIYACSLFWNQFADRFSAYIMYSIFCDIPLGMLLAWIVKKGQKEETKQARKKGKWSNTKWSKAFMLMAAMLAMNSIFTGCAKMTDVEDWDYVLTLGIDEGEYTFGINTGEDTKTVSISAQSLDEAVQKYEDTHPHKIQLGHVTAIVLGEAYLPDEIVHNRKAGTDDAEEEKDNEATENTTNAKENKETIEDKKKETAQQGEESTKLHINQYKIKLTDKWKTALEDLEKDKEIPISTSVYTVTQKAKEAMEYADSEKQTLGEYLDDIYGNNRKSERKELSLRFFQEALYKDDKLAKVTVVETE